MQEEVENRTVNLVVSTTKLTARSLIRGLRWYLMSRNQKRMRKAMAHEEGKQSVKELLKAGVSTDKIELPDGSAKDFCKLAKKFGVDYAIRKEKFHFDYEIIDWDKVTEHLPPIDTEAIMKALADPNLGKK